jgi:glutathione S-transferase
MNAPLLVIGNYNYSSWSLRAWLALRKSGTRFDVVRLPLDTPEFAAAIGRYSPTGRVPVLHHQGRQIWDSLAIAEYANEQFAGGALLPADASERARARSLMAEMHSGFTALRQAMPMNCRARRRLPVSPEVGADVTRIDALWTECRRAASAAGPWLFGAFSLADAFFAPVASRFHTYGVPLSATAAEYRDSVLSDADMIEWLRAGREEPEVVAADEAGTPVTA